MLHSPGPEALRSPLLDHAAFPGLRHGFFTRRGGRSTGLYEALNVGSGSRDERESVAANRALVAKELGVAPERLLTPHQVHSCDAVIVSEPFAGDKPRADGIVTDRPGLAVGVVTADCGPVLFADPEAGIIGAAHAGWKGALGGVVEATIEAMERLGAERQRIVAALGPSISARNYEVGPEFVARFLETDRSSEIHFTPSEREGHSMFDLRAYTICRLERAGLKAELVAPCTYADEERFYSYRRSTHRGEADYGRQISAIVMEAR